MIFLTLHGRTLLNILTISLIHSTPPCVQFMTRYTYRKGNHHHPSSVSLVQWHHLTNFANSASQRVLWTLSLSNSTYENIFIFLAPVMQLINTLHLSFPLCLKTRCFPLHIKETEFWSSLLPLLSSQRSFFPLQTSEKVVSTRIMNHLTAQTIEEFF